MPIVVVPKKVYSQLLSSSLWSKMDLQPGRGYYSPTGHNHLVKLVKQLVTKRYRA